MRIYGGKDYYDNVAAWGQDPKTVLVRSTDLSFPADNVPLKVGTLDLVFSGRGFTYISSHWIVVVLCDKVYRGLVVSAVGGDYYFWNIEKLKSWAEDNQITISLRKRWFRSREDITLDNCMDPQPISDQLREFMLQHRLAILVDTNVSGREDRQIQANPRNLKQYGFAKAVDPYTAFQELSMWISGVLGGMSPEMVYITDDKVILEGHGFDKHSFRSSLRT